ncbi:MAG: hypothetical protein JW757_08795 [Anaerolineales bacterium]|nr:hypothetical protein [Anaerolineales bacterium]
MTSEPILYSEKLSSKKTQLLFIALSLLFMLLTVWRVIASGVNTLAGVLFFFSAFFLFYVINFRTLLIQLSSNALRLKFGIFHWTVPLNNISACLPDDDLPWLMKYGGAGIHFMMVRNRYRASFNFLEYPRVVIHLEEKFGWVRDISFSTRNPDELIRQIQNAITSDSPA